MKHLLVASRLDDVIGEVDQKLSQTALSSGIIAEDRRESGIAKRLRQALAKSLASASVIAQAKQRSAVVLKSPHLHVPKETPNNVLEQADRLLFDKLVDHVAEDRADGVEALVCLANVCQTNVVQQDLLYDEDGNCLAKLRACLHDTKT